MMRSYRRLFLACLWFGTFAASPATAANLLLPATGVWNGFNEHLNVVECSNISESNVTLRFTVKSDSGQVLGTQAAYLAAYGTSHLILNLFPIHNRYGTFVIELLSGAFQSGGLSCNTVIYRLADSQSPKVLDYAFALPVQNPLTGESYGTINSMNPSGGATPIFNWLTVYNPGTNAWNGTVEARREDGSLLSPGTFVVRDLAPGARIDIPLAHPIGQLVGLYRILPDDTTQAYGAFLARYAEDQNGSFRFALALEAKQTVCGEYTVPASTMDPALNWGEIANPGPDGFVVQAEIRDGFGNLRGQEDLWIAPYSQRHVYINASLGDRNVGTLRLRCLGNPPSGTKLLLQSLFYGYRQSPGDLSWAYGSQAETSEAVEGTVAAFSFNTFFGAANWVKYLDTAETAGALSTSLYQLGGSPLAQRSNQLIADGGIDFAVHEQVGANSAGLVFGSSSNPAVSFRSELLRVYGDSRGGIGTILKIPATYIERGDANQGAASPLPSGHWFEFRNQPRTVIGDSVSQAFMELGTDFDFMSYLDKLAEHGANTIMIWSYIGIVDQSADSRIGYHAPRLWPWNETSLQFVPPYTFQFVAADGTALFNEAYFSRLRTFIGEANKRNIMVIITVHDGWTKERFAGHPFNISNGGALTSREQYVELADYSQEMPIQWNPSWTRQQKHQFLLERFSDRLIQASAGYSNVMFEMMNEGEWYNQTQNRAFQLHFLDFFKARTSAALIINDDHIGGDHFREEPNADVISLHAPGWNTSTSAKRAFDHYAERFFSLNPQKKPIIFNEPVPEYRGGLSQRTAMTRLMWGTLLGGGGFLVPNDTSWKWNPDNIDPIFELVGHAARFFHAEGIRFEAMQPDEQLCTSKVCLAAVGEEYLLYSQSGGETAVDLSSVSGTFLVRFYNPFTGTFDANFTTAVVGGAERTFIKPTSSDWVVWLKKQG